MASAADTIPEIPVEIFYEIIGHYLAFTENPTPELLTWLRVNSALRAIALDYLFHNVTLSYAIIPHAALDISQLAFFGDDVDGKTSGPRFLDLLYTSPRVASRVRNLTIIISPLRTVSPVKEELQRNAANRRRSSLQKILPLLTSLDRFSFPFRGNHISWRALHDDSRKCLKYVMKGLPSSVTKLDVRGINHFPISLILIHPNLNQVSFGTLTDSLGNLNDMRLPFGLSARPLQLSHLHLDLQGLSKWAPHVFDMTQLKSLEIRARSASIEVARLDIEALEMCTWAGMLESIHISMLWYFHRNIDGHSEYPDLLNLLASGLHLRRHHRLRSITLSIVLSMCYCINNIYATIQPFPALIQTFLSGAQPTASVTINLNILEEGEIGNLVAMTRFIETLRAFEGGRVICIVIQEIRDYGGPKEQYLRLDWEDYLTKYIIRRKIGFQ